MKAVGRFFTMIALLTLVSGCGDSNAPGTSASNSSAPVGGTKARVTYTATLEEGIDFKREGYPTYVSTVLGLADEKEFFGRWSTEDEVILGFVNPLPTNFTIELEAAAFGPNVNRPIKILVGGKEQEFLLSSGHPEKMQTTRIPIAGVENAKSIKLRIPFATSPKALVGSPDERRLGIAFGKIRILE